MPLRRLLVGSITWVGFLGALQSAMPRGCAAQEATPAAPAPHIDVSLVTFGPGPKYWEAFGHNALWIRDPSTGLDAMFNYGMFSFQQESFLWRFIKGRMLYSVAPQDPERSLRAYKAQDRSIWIQELNLTDEQRVALRDFLVWNVQPENRDYRYHYYLDNCSTRIRDAIDRVIGGRIEARTANEPSGTTFRFHTQRYTYSNIPYYTGLLVGLARPVDRPISKWQEMFIPMELRDHIRDVTVFDEAGVERPLVASEQVYYESSVRRSLDRPPRWMIWYLAVGVVVAAGVLALGRVTSGTGGWGFATFTSVWGLFIGVAGLALIFLWAFTDHNTSYGNENLFFLTPLALPLVITAPLAAAGRMRAKKATAYVALAVVASSVLGVLVKVLPWFYQVNGQLLALFLPINGAVALAAWRAYASGGSNVRDPRT
jgi:Domain of unknown function (DUF4105)